MWMFWMAAGFIAGRFGEAIIKWGWAQAKARGWV